ncbi:lipocalin-like domain-containing protein [Marivita hallyeonensis]|uniref:Predicted secreted hydrolase n=1 Tax=Marivita hallyeonensis TaxID=996342 RepID=A0A1M5VJK8_9RHOB|nr:lipocalin-like domain-containing protein [Marivita hallyeonensis]SHH75385.1 Predicted secreted hydrolase [Marivita hallyeonensis]
MIARVLLILLLLPALAQAQGFAGLGTEADDFAVPRAGYRFDFPQDHGPHPDFRIEWWYLTANLEAEDGTPYGVQWTLFRSALAPETADGWGDPQVWFAHAALTTEDAHYVAERIARGGIGQAGVTVQPFNAWIDDWRMAGPSFDDMRLTARGAEFAYDLNLLAEGPLVFHGDAGYSVKSDQGQASYYYSQPYFRVSGSLTLPGGEVAVTGSAWLDREWSSQPLADTQSGWDWFSLSFDSGDKLMGFLLRETDGTSFSSATWIAPDGTTTAFPNGAFRAQPLDITRVAGRDIPTRWAVQLPERDVDVTVKALNPNAWMGVSIPYWEGPVTVEGSHSGKGYLEMTGYE